jgi:SAM-dependent methyltransferase
MAYRLSARYDYRGYEPDPISYRTATGRLQALGRGEVINEAVPGEPDRSFDLLVAFEVLEHIEDDKGALGSWVRWLTPGGHLIMSVPAHPERFGPCDEMVGHCRRYTRPGVVELIESAGLEPLAVESWGMPVGYALEAVRNQLAKRSSVRNDIGTSGSGRIYQPPSSWGRAVELAIRPLAALQRPFRDGERGVGYVAVSRLQRAKDSDDR